MSGSGGSSTIIDSLVVTLGLDPSNFVSNKDRAKEATAAIAAGVEDIDKAGAKTSQAQAKRDRESSASKKQEERDSAKRTKEQQRVHDQAIKENERRDKAFATAKDKQRSEEVRKEKEAERERTQANRKAAKERKEGYDTAKEAALGFAAAVASVVAVDAIKNTANSVAELGRTAHNLDLPTAEVTAWGNAIASSVGGNAQAAIATLGGLSDSLVKMRTQGDQSLIPLIAQLEKFSGVAVSLKGADGKFVGPEQLMKNISAAGQKMDPAVFSSILRENGFDAGTINFLEKGPGAVDAGIEAAKRRGVPDEKEAQAAARMATEIENVTQQFLRLEQVLVFRFGPDISRFLKDLSSLFDVASGKTSWADFKKARTQHWHEAEVEALVNTGLSPADAEAKASAADAAADAQSSTLSPEDKARAKALTLPLNLRNRVWRNLGMQPESGVDTQAPPASAVPSVGPTGLRQSAQLPADIEAEVRKDAIARGVDPDHMVALFRAEGGGYDKVSSAGAYGPAQLMPDTAAGLGISAGPGDPDYKWQDNVEGGVRYWASLLHQFNGQTKTADAAYNAGPNKYGVKVMASSGDTSNLPAETQAYVRQIQANLVPGATAPVSTTSHNDNSSTSHVTIGKMDVHTQAKDADAIAAGMNDAMKHHPLMVQANTGLE